MTEVRDRKDMLLEAGLTLASELSLPVVLQRIVDLATRVTDARYGALGVIGEGDKLVEFVTAGITPRQRQSIGDLPTGRGVLGLLIRNPHPLRIRNIPDDPHAVGFPANHPIMRSFLGAPVRAMGRIYGNIYLAEKLTADEFTPEDQEALVVLATQAGVAIANASLYEEVRSRESERRRLSVMEERERIAKELHDGIIQSLFATGMSLQATAAMAGSPDAAKRIEGAVEELDRVIRDLRNYIFALRPGILADRQLDQALRHLADEMLAGNGLAVEVSVDAEVAAALTSRSAEVVQLAREALSNVVRHAHASRATLSLSRQGPNARLTVEDDGVGFDPSLKSVGSGLRNMRQRATSLGGQLELSSHAGNGTRLTIRFPITV